MPSAKFKDSAVEFNKAISQSGELEAKALAGSQRALYVEEGWRTSSPSHTALGWETCTLCINLCCFALRYLWLIRGLLWSERSLENNWWFLSWCLNVILFLVISFLSLSQVVFIVRLNSKVVFITNQLACYNGTTPTKKSVTNQIFPAVLYPSCSRHEWGLCLESELYMSANQTL